MYEFENESWEIKLRLQYDKAFTDLTNLLETQDALRDEIESQLAFMYLLAELLDPSD